ncbi:MAG TPA: hypothetical protein VKA85_09910 [Candidatus Limnocylindrales bacterium]|nr:hypothetical protein [Candidatus Limnocylindrales bacterium]
MTTPQVVRSGPPVPTRLQLPGGYYDPDSATFDEMRPANVDALMTSTTPVAPRPALARSSS